MAFIRKFTLLFISITLYSSSSFGQDKIIVGKVIDSKTELALRNTLVKTKNSSVNTDSIGNFRIKAVSGDTIRFNILGYLDKFVVFSNQLNLTISLGQARLLG